MSMYFLKLNIDYDTWSAVLLTEYIPSMMVWLWAISHTRYCCFFLTREIALQVFQIFSIAEFFWWTTALKSPDHSGHSSGSPENSVSFSFGKQLASQLSTGWKMTWEEVCFTVFLFLLSAVFIVDYGTLTPVSVLECWCFLRLKRLPCHRRLRDRYSIWFMNLSLIEDAKLCQWCWRDSCTRLK